MLLWFLLCLSTCSEWKMRTTICLVLVPVVVLTGRLMYMEELEIHGKSWPKGGAGLCCAVLRVPHGCGINPAADRIGEACWHLPLGSWSRHHWHALVFISKWSSMLSVLFDSRNDEQRCLRTSSKSSKDYHASEPLHGWDLCSVPWLRGPSNAAQLGVPSTWRDESLTMLSSFPFHCWVQELEKNVNKTKTVTLWF